MNHFRSALIGAASTLIMAGAAHAQSKAYSTPNVTTAAGATTVTLGGNSFVNQGLVGVGRLSATTRDFANETLGSFSGMAMDLSSWRRAANGSYTGKIFTLPDRGPNDVGPIVGTTDYRNRVHTHTISLTPYAGTAATTPTQMSITPTGGFFLVDQNGANFSGQDPGAGTTVRDGVTYPMATSGPTAGRLSLDPEAIAFLPDGSFYITDEYSTGLYYFDAAGKLAGGSQAIPALLPRTAGAINFNGLAAPTTGRRNNQGLEAAAVTPDATRLVTILQSATVQDTNGAAQQTRNNVRVLVYDITQSRTPANPIGHYALQLPIFREAGDGGAPNLTAAQSEMLALNDTQFLVLSRDGNGRGKQNGFDPVYKSVLLIDTTGATNLAGTAFETTTQPIAANGALVAGITPVQQVELVNMLNPVQLGRFGLNMNNRPSNSFTLSEKIEAMGLAPVLDENAPNDFFLLVGNDNDFQAQSGRIAGLEYDASLRDTASGLGSNDSSILVYRLTLPTYVDPLALRTMKAASPLMIAAGRAAAVQVGSIAAQASLGELDSLRRIDRLDQATYAEGARVWANGGYLAFNSVPNELNRALGGDGWGGAFGADFGVAGARFGGALAYQSFKDELGQGFNVDAKGWSGSLYGGYVAPSGWYLQGALGYSPKMKLERMQRPGAYGLDAAGAADADVKTGSGQFGLNVASGAWRGGPYIAAEHVRVDIDGYVERGGALNNARVGQQEFSRTRLSLGLETATHWKGVIPSFRAAYVRSRAGGDRTATVGLAAVNHSSATQALEISRSEDDHFLAGASVEGFNRGFGWRIGLEGRFLDRTDARATIGFSKRF